MYPALKQVLAVHASSPHTRGSKDAPPPLQQELCEHLRSICFWEPYLSNPYLCVATTTTEQWVPHFHLLALCDLNWLLLHASCSGAATTGWLLSPPQRRSVACDFIPCFECWSGLINPRQLHDWLIKACLICRPVRCLLGAEDSPRRCRRCDAELVLGVVPLCVTTPSSCSV